MATRQKSKAAEQPTEQSAKYKSRMVLEDAIEDFARAYAAWCMHKATSALTERTRERMMDALEAHERVIAQGGHSESA